MAAVTVLYGPAYDGKIEESFRKILNALHRREGHTCAYLVRSDIRVRQLRERIFRELSGNFSPFPVRTLPDFLKQWYLKTPGSKRLLGELEQKLLIEDLLTEPKHRSKDLSYFTSVRKHPGILVKIREFLSAVRRIGFASSEELASEFQRCRGRQQVLYECLLTVFDLYQERLEYTHVIDEAGIFLELAQKAVEGSLSIHSLIPNPQLLVLEGYYELTRPGQQIFTALCSQFDRSFLTLDCPENPYAIEDMNELPSPFHLFRDMAEYIRQAGFSVREYVQGLPGPLPKILPGDEHSEPFHVLNRPPDTICLQASQNRKEEVSRIAREIATLWRNNTVSELREIGVTFPVLDHYAPLIQEIFPLYGIPFTMFQGDALASSLVVLTVFRLMQVVHDGYSRESLQQLFSSPLVHMQHNGENSWLTDISAGPSVCKDADDPPLSLGLDSHSYPYFESLAQEAEIAGGRQEWIEKLLQLETELAEKEQQGCQSNDVSAAYACIPAFFQLLRLLERFDTDQRYPLEDYLQFLHEALRQLHIPQRIFETEDRSIREKDCAALRSFLNVIETIKQEFSDTPSRGPQAQRSRYADFTLREFADFLKTLIQGERYYGPEKLEDSVFILGRLDTRQVRFQYLFFGGLIEKDFPGQEEPNIFLSQQDSEQLGLPTYTDKLQEASHLFYLNMLNPEQMIYLSYPLQDAEKDVLRSTYIERLLKALGEKELQSEFPEQEPVSPENLYTYTETYQWLGTHWNTEAGNNDVDTVLKFMAQQKGEHEIEQFGRRVQVQQSRRAFRLGPFDGMLASRWAHNRLKPHYTHHVYSVSEFDLYVRCPLKYFFRRILWLEPLPDILPAVTAIDIGNLLHKIVYRFYVDPSANGESDRNFLQHKNASDTWLTEARQRMSAIAREELAAYPFSGAFWDVITRSILSGLPGSSQVAASDSEPHGILAQFTELEAFDREKTIPRYLEAHFGMADFRNARPDFTDSEQFGYQLSAPPYTLHGRDADGNSKTISIRGTIDRIDIEPADASSDTRPKGVIYDYKTGGMSSLKALKEGRSFQLPLYLLAARELLGECCEVVAGGYYLLKTQEVGKKQHLGCKEHSEQRYFKGYTRTLFNSYEEVLELLDRYADLAIQRSVDILGGTFHPTTLDAKDAGCEWCDYRQICRVDYQRMRNIRQ
ncbi:hypothetical protein CSA56_02380 [candidate division KSB3 bacterium]|uniref:PD-(D/E)XK endonuclease-like domain-containing protein n=1 Tax=candidate division KSB3 bacterium TaxID=2044937 RepID=A0A2G6KKK0_9BACT|nr:MAG: hypothetical protein CSA56_02380 [candidate division KSB3 bacterium]